MGKEKIDVTEQLQEDIISEMQRKHIELSKKKVAFRIDKKNVIYVTPDKCTEEYKQSWINKFLK